MRASLRHTRVLTGIALLSLAGLATFLLPWAFDRKQRVVFSDGSRLIVRKVTYGKNNLYWHHPARRAAAVLGADHAWEWGIQKFPRLFSSLGATEVNSSVQSGDDCLVVFGEFYPGPAKTRSLEFTGIDGDGKESGPLETDMLIESDAPTKVNRCILAYGKNIPNRWPIAVRIYERDTNGVRKLLAQLPAKRAQK